VTYNFIVPLFKAISPHEIALEVALFI